MDRESVEPDTLERIVEEMRAVGREGEVMGDNAGTISNLQAPPKCPRCRFEHYGDDCAPTLAFWLQDLLARVAFLNDVVSGRANTEDVARLKAISLTMESGTPGEPDTKEDYTNECRALRAIIARLEGERCQMRPKP